MYKSLGISAVLVVLGLGLFLWPRIVSQKVIPSFFPKTITTFCINNLCLLKNGQTWEVLENERKIPADSEKIELFLANLSDFTLENPVSTNKDRQDQFGFKTDSTTISVGDKKLEIGGISPGFDATYVRLPQGDVIYRLSGVLSPNMMVSGRYWEQMTITNLPLYQITSINDYRPGSDGIWKQAAWVEKVAHLSGTDYLTTKPNDPIWRTFVVKYEGGTITLRVGKKWATINENDYYALSATDFDLLTSVR